MRSGQTGSRVRAERHRLPRVEVDRAILSAAVRVLNDAGQSGLTIEAVARAAGVAESTIYRRYKDKADLARATIVTSEHDWPPMNEVGGTRAALIAFFEDLRQDLQSGSGDALIDMLVPAETANRDVTRAQRGREGIRRLAIVREILVAGRASGELREDVDLEVAIDALVGALLLRQTRGSAADPGFVERAVDAVLDGIAPRR